MRVLKIEAWCKKDRSSRRKLQNLQLLQKPENVGACTYIFQSRPDVSRSVVSPTPLVTSFTCLSAPAATIQRPLINRNLYRPSLLCSAPPTKPHLWSVPSPVKLRGRRDRRLHFFTLTDPSPQVTIPSPRGIAKMESAHSTPTLTPPPQEVHNLPVSGIYKVHRPTRPSCPFASNLARRVIRVSRSSR
jgi:hypothetical protein